jgi:integrase
MKRKYKEFCRVVLQSSQITPSDTLNFFTIINIETNLFGFIQIASNLKSILPYLIDIDPKTWKKNDIDKWVTICDLTIKHQSKLKKNIKYKTIDKSGDGGLRGSIKKFPLYCALWHQPPSKKYSDEYYHLQAHFINAYYLFSDKNSKPLKKYEAIISNISLLIRNVKLDFLKLLPKTTRNTCQFKKISSNLQSINIHIDNDINLLKRMFAYIHKDRKTSTRNRTQHTQKRLSAVITNNMLDPDSEIITGENTVIKQSNLTKAESDESFKQGNAPTENLAGPPISMDKKSVNKNESFKDYLKKSKARSKNISTNNQNLPSAWERLNIHDVVYLYREIFDLLSGLLGLKKPETELIALISIMHWTSTPIERSLTTKIYRSVKDIPQQVGPNQIYYCIEEEEWVISLPELHQRKKANSNWSNILEDVSSFIRLPADPLCVRLLNPLVKLKSQGIKSTGRPLFNTDRSIMESNLKTFIGDINKHHRSRITIRRISNHMFHLLLDKTGDIAEVSFMTGSIPHTGQMAALYYYAPNTIPLQKLYTELCSTIRKTIYRSLNKKNQGQVRNINSNTSQRIGSQICPLNETMKCLVDDLKAKVNFCRKDHKNTSYIIDFHNAFTSYCVMLFSFSTGYRSVRDPFYSENEIDWDSEFVVISDKDSDDYYNSRIVWIPDLCQQQLHKYIAHRKAMSERLIFLNPQLAERLKGDKISPWSRDKKIEYQIPFFFFLNEKAKDVKVSSTSLSEHLKWSYELPLNANRHYLRTHLRQLKVPAEIVDAYMGHWEEGQEPFGKYSTLSPLEFKKELKGKLEKLTTNAGWSLLEGFHNHGLKSPWSNLPTPTTSAGGADARKGVRLKARLKEEKTVISIIEQEEPFLIKQGKQKYTLSKKRVAEIAPIITKDCDGYHTKLRYNYFVKILKNKSKKNHYKIYLPPLMQIKHREKSPFTPNSFTYLKALKEINRQFINTVKDPDFFSDTNKYCNNIKIHNNFINHTKAQQLQAGQILFSAIVNGALLNKKWIIELGKSIDLNPKVEGDLIWLEMSKSIVFGEKTHTLYNRWYPDPLTALLILRWKKKKFIWPKEINDDYLKQVELLLKRYYTSMGLQVSQHPSLTQLIDTTKTNIGLQIPQYLVQYACGRKSSVSLSPHSWARLLKNYVNKSKASNSLNTTKAIPDNKVLQNKSITLYSEYPEQYKYLKQLREIINQDHKQRTPSRKEITQEIHLFLKNNKRLSPIITAIANWSLNLITHKSVTGNRIKASSLRTYFSYIASNLTLYAEEKNILEFTENEWISLYDLVLDKNKEIEISAVKAGVLAVFHLFLEYEYGLIHISIEGAPAKFSRVNANILTPREYVNTQNYLAKDASQSSRLIRIQKILLMLGFRCGLRRGEARQLKLNELQDGQEKGIIGATLSLRPELLIRNNIFGTVKHTSSIRRIPLYPLLTTDEINELISWKKKRLLETPNKTITNELLFCNKGEDLTQLDDKDIFDVIQHAMRATSNDLNLRFHHLRHSFINITFLRLLTNKKSDLLLQNWCLDTDGSEILPTTHTQSILRLTKKDSPSRKLLYATCLLAGHSDPEKTMHSYLHLLDYILGKELSSIPIKLSHVMQANLLGITPKSISKYRTRNELSKETTTLDLLKVELRKKRVKKYQPQCYSEMKPVKKIYPPPFVKVEQPPPSPMTLYYMLRRRHQKQDRKEIASHYDFTNKALYRWESRARELAKLRTRRDKYRFVRTNKTILTAKELAHKPTLPWLCPAPPHDKQETKEVQEIFENILTLNKTNPTLLKDGLCLYLKTSTFKKTIMNPRNDNDRLLFVNFLKGIKIAQNRIRVHLTVGSQKSEQEQLKHWMRLLKLPKSNFVIKTKPKNKPTKHPYGQVRIWIAKKYSKSKTPIHKKAKTWPAHSLRFTLYMSLITFDICE